MLKTTRFGGLLLLLGGLAACGSSGGEAQTEPTDTEAPALAVDFGLVSASAPTTKLVSLTNPLSVAATLTETGSEGPFAIVPAQLPATVPASGRIDVAASFSPLSPGVASGTADLLFTGEGASSTLQVNFQASAEPVGWALSPDVLNFGVVTAGSTTSLPVTLRNTSTLTTVVLLGGVLDDTPFAVDPTSFPATLGPGDSTTVSVAYEPLGEGGHAAEVQFSTDVPGASPDVLASGSVAGPNETVNDYGLVEIAGTTTATLTVNVPADAISLTLEGWVAGGTGGATVTVPMKINPLPGVSTAIGLDSFTGPGGHVYENTAGTGPYLWLEEEECFAVSVPSSDRAALQLVPGGGTYSFRLKRVSGSGGHVHVRAVVETRGAADPTSAILDLNVFLANGLGVTAANAPTDARLQSILQTMHSILTQEDVYLGQVAYFDVADPNFDQVSESEFPLLLRLTQDAPEARANLFFVVEAIGGGVVGVSAVIGGGKRNGTGTSGVMSVYDSGFATGTIALIAAHELGHFLGLFHTVEQSGSHDLIDDTAECPPDSAGGPCAVEGGGLLMHWKAVGGIDISPGQGLVLRGHPLLAPGSSTGPHLKTRFALSPTVLEELRTLPSNWCGTCAKCREAAEED